MASSAFIIRSRARKAATRTLVSYRLPTARCMAPPTTGGANSSGTFFATTALGSFVTYDLPKRLSCQGFTAANGPRAPLVVGPDGNLYGTRLATVGSPCFSEPGRVLRLTPAGLLTEFWPPGFTNPETALVVGADGNLYGTAVGNMGSPSTAFRFTPTGQFTSIHQFTDPEGTTPRALVRAPDGNFYGTAWTGGPFGQGSIFRMTASGDVTVLYGFQGPNDGSSPRAGLVLASDGNFYGVASDGGTYGAGTIFKISPSGAFSVVYTFTGGLEPVAALIETKDGTFYGTAQNGGAFGRGVVFKLRPPRPLLIIDAPQANATLAGPFVLSGWAVDRGAWTGAGIDAVHIYPYPNPGSGIPPVFLGSADYGHARSDIGALLGNQFTNAGFSLPVAGLAAGAYQLAVFGHSAVTQTFSVVASTILTVIEPPSDPVMALDGPVSDSTVGNIVTVIGWAIDREATTGAGVDAVHVWAYPNDGSAPQLLGAAVYGFSRPDVGGAFGSQFGNSGYRLTVTIDPGTYMFVAFARSTVTGTFNASVAASHVTVLANSSNPALLIDAPGQHSSVTQPFVVSGWAVDQGANTGSGISAVHVWAFPTSGAPAMFVTKAIYGSARPDVAAFFGDNRFMNSGFSAAITAAQLPDGAYDLVVFGQSTVTGAFTVARSVRVSVQ